MKKEEVYLDLTKLTKEQLINVAECVKDEMYSISYKNLINGVSDNHYYLYIFNSLWVRGSGNTGKKEITYSEFLGNFGIMTETEQKLYDYAVSVDWDVRKIVNRFGNSEHRLNNDEYNKLEGEIVFDKVTIFVDKHKPQLPESITLPIEDYNRLRKLEIKAEIKKLKREMKGL